MCIRDRYLHSSPKTYRVMDINPPKCSDIDFINFLIAASNVFSCTEAARCYLFVANAPSHDACTRCLQRQPTDTEALWDEVKNHVKPEEGFRIQYFTNWIRKSSSFIPISKYFSVKCLKSVSYTHLTLPTTYACRSRWSPYH